MVQVYFHQMAILALTHSVGSPCRWLIERLLNIFCKREGRRYNHCSESVPEHFSAVNVYIDFLALIFVYCCGAVYVCHQSSL